MRYTFTGKNMTVSDTLKERTTNKLNRLEKFLSPDTEVTVKYSVTKLDHKIEVTIPLNRRTLRAEVVAPDMYAALDMVIDVLEKQLVKYKERLHSRSRKDSKYKEELNSVFTPDSATEEDSVVIQKTKKFAVKPMDADEAVMEMELLGHNFYVFRNPSTTEVNVVYKRNDGTYGLIEPEV